MRKEKKENELETKLFDYTQGGSTDRHLFWNSDIIGYMIIWTLIDMNEKIIVLLLENYEMFFLSLHLL